MLDEVGEAVSSITGCPVTLGSVDGEATLTIEGLGDTVGKRVMVGLGKMVGSNVEVGMSTGVLVGRSVGIVVGVGTVGVGTVGVGIVGVAVVDAPIGASTGSVVG